VFLGDLVYENTIVYPSIGPELSKRPIFYFTELSWAVAELAKLTLSMKAYGATTALIGSKFENLRGKHGSIDPDSSNNEYSAMETGQTILCPFMVEGAHLIKSTNFGDIKKDSAISKKTIAKDLKNDAELRISRIFSSLGQTNGADYSKKPSVGLPIASKPHSKTPKEVAPKGVVLIKNNWIRILLGRVMVALVGLTFLYLSLPFLFHFSSYLGTKMLITDYLLTRPSIGVKTVPIVRYFSEKAFQLSEKKVALGLLPTYYTNLSVDAREVYSVTVVLEDFNKSNMDILSLLSDGSESTDWSRINQLALSFEHLGSEIAMLRAETDVRVKLLSTEKLKEISRTVNLWSGLTRYAPDLLGKDTVKKYALIVQEPDQLRPTGGKITVIGVLSVSGGRIENFTVYPKDIHVESRSVGDVEAPGSYSKYFGSDSWNINEANWFSDFPTSAKKIIWFAHHTLEEKLDGVIALSKDTLELIPRKSNKTTDITSKIVGEVGDEEAKILISAVTSASNKANYHDARLLTILSSALMQRTLLLYFDYPQMQYQLSLSQLAAGVERTPCGQNCFSDLLGEAEIAKTAGSKGVLKEIDLDVSLEEGLIKKRMTIYASNSNDAVYQTVFRVFTPVESGFSRATIVSRDDKYYEDGTIDTVSGIKNYEVPVTIKPGETIGVSYYWEQPMDTAIQKYVLKLYKQPGENDYPFTVGIRVPEDYDVVTSPDFLTEGNTLVYNTRLSGNLDLQIDLRRK